MVFIIVIKEKTNADGLLPNYLGEYDTDIGSSSL
jgi:hypothetical protein